MQVSQKADEQYTSIFDGFTKILANEGVKGLYGGLKSKIVQSVLTAGFLFLGKEALFKWAVWILVLSGARQPRIGVKA